MTKLGKKEEILDLLDKKPLTTREISSELSISEDDVRTYLRRLKKEGKIKVIGIKERYKIYFTKDPIELLAFLNSFFKENVSYLAKNKQILDFILENEDVFNRIEELIK